MVRSHPDWAMVPLADAVPGIFQDIRYTTKNNFTGKVLYKKHELFFGKAAADKLLLVQDSLRKLQRGLLVWDAYRPYAATLAMWEVVPDDRYAANPANGSGHNRGIAIDCTLADLTTGKPVEMPTDFDNFSDTAHLDFYELDSVKLANRSLFIGIMKHYGFVPLDTEWWHFYLPEPKQYPLMDFRFRQLRRWTK